MPKNVGDLDKFIVAKGFKKLPKVQKIAQSGHTGGNEEFKKIYQSITVKATSCLTGLHSLVLLKLTYLLVWLNTNQSNKRSAVQ